ncbi:MAG TPA: hypothetical protein VGC34_11795, partial [Steroidobacteraceae bacterium]
MPRASKSIVGALLMPMALAGCFGAHFAPETPKGVELQGVWKLNHTASDDPQKVVDTLRAEALKKLRRAMNAPQPSSMGDPNGGGGGGRRRGGGGGGGGGVGNAGVSEQPTQDELRAAQGPGMDPLRNSPTMH